jgi:hypothetical protein
VSPDLLSKAGAPIAAARGQPRRMAGRYPLPVETGADEPDVNRPRPPVEARSIAKLLSFQRPRASRARPRSLAHRLPKHKSGPSGGRQEVRAEPPELGNSLQRAGGVEHGLPLGRVGKPLSEIGEGKRDPLHPTRSTSSRPADRTSSRSSSGRWQYALNDPSTSGMSRPVRSTTSTASCMSVN